MSDTPASETADVLWPRIKQEITGIQLLWETVEQMYFRAPRHRGIALLGADTPLLYGLMQTAMMESLLMRMSRLMDPAATGRGQGAKPNLSLARLGDCFQKLDSDVCELRQQWDASGLKAIRDKYLSHNDLARTGTEPHSLNIPLLAADVSAMKSLAEGLRAFRRAAQHKMGGAAYLDGSLDLQVQREIDVLSRSLLAGEAFYELLPDHACLQDALQGIEQIDSDKEPPC